MRDMRKTTLSQRAITLEHNMRYRWKGENQTKILVQKKRKSDEKCVNGSRFSVFLYIGRAKTRIPQQQQSCKSENLLKKQISQLFTLR